MKFGKIFDAYVADVGRNEVNHVGVKSLKKIIKSCRKAGCQECSSRFFGLLSESINGVLSDFTDHANLLLKKHTLASKWPILVSLRPKNHEGIPENAVSLVAYVTMNHIAVRKMVKKFEKFHGLVPGELKISILEIDRQLARSPLLIELTALSVVLGRPVHSADLVMPAVRQDCDDDVIVLCELGKDSEDEEESSDVIIHGVRLTVTSLCSVCLETLHDPVALVCGHVFCNVCACESAGIPLAFGLKSAPKKSKCPLCRQCDAFRTGKQLKLLDILFKSRNPEKWKSRETEIRKNIHQQRSDYWQREAEQMERWRERRAQQLREMRGR